MSNVSPFEGEPRDLPESETLEKPKKPERPTERQDAVTGKLEITFRGKYNLEVLPAGVADIEQILGNVLKSESERDQKEMDAVRKKIEKTDGFTKSAEDEVKTDEVATEEIESSEKSNEQLVIEDDHRVRDLFLRLVNQLDVSPGSSQNKIRKLTDSGSKYVFSEFVTSFKNSDQNRLGDNVADHWATEQDCFEVSDATAGEIMKTFDGINNKSRYGYQLTGEKEDVMILNLNGIKVAFIIDGGHHREDKTQV